MKNHADHDEQAHHADMERAAAEAQSHRPSARLGQFDVVYRLQLAAFSHDRQDDRGSIDEHTECIASSKHARKLLKVGWLNIAQLALIAHHLDFVPILEEIEEDQFFPGSSGGTDST